MVTEEYGVKGSQERVEGRTLDDIVSIYIEKKVLESKLVGTFKGVVEIGYTDVVNEISYDAYKRVEGLYLWYIEKMRKRTIGGYLYKDTMEGTKYSIKIKEDRGKEYIYQLRKTVSGYEGKYIIYLKGLGEEIGITRVDSEKSLEEIIDLKNEYENNEGYRERTDLELDLKDVGFELSKLKNRGIKTLEELGAERKDMDKVDYHFVGLITEIINYVPDK